MGLSMWRTMWTKQLDRVLLVPGPGGAGLARTEDSLGCDGDNGTDKRVGLD